MQMELFELELLGGDTEKRYRELQPNIESMPWRTIDVGEYPKELLVSAQQAWTVSAFQEYRTGAACAAMLRTLLEARAPLDLIALATRFPLDEVVHSELCARFAMSLGGAAAIEYDPAALVPAVGHESDDAERAIESICESWNEIRARPTGAELPIGDMGWMDNEAYVALAEHSLRKLVIGPLRERGIMVCETGSARNTPR